MAGKRATALAEKMASRHMENAGLTKAFGTHDDLVKAFLPFGEMSVKLDKKARKGRKIARRIETQQRTMAEMLERGDVNAEHERVFLKNVEKHYADTSGQHPMVMMNYPVPSANGHK